MKEKTLVKVYKILINSLLIAIKSLNKVLIHFIKVVNKLTKTETILEYCNKKQPIDKIVDINEDGHVTQGIIKSKFYYLNEQFYVRILCNGKIDEVIFSKEDILKSYLTFNENLRDELIIVMKNQDHKLNQEYHESK